MPRSDTTPAWPAGLAPWGEAEILRPLSGAHNRLYEITLDGRPSVASRSDCSAACLDAWRSLAEQPSSVVHGDPHAGNILIDGDTVALLDWDEARVDASILDIAALPPAHVGAPAWARRAVDAWEVACSWHREPAYARERLAALYGGNC